MNGFVFNLDAEIGRKRKTSKATKLIALETISLVGNLIRKQLVCFPTIFPLLIDKTGSTMIIMITSCVSRFANLLKLLRPNYLFVISGLAVQIRPWAPIKSRG